MSDVESASLGASPSETPRGGAQAHAPAGSGADSLLIEETRDPDGSFGAAWGAFLGLALGLALLRFLRLGDWGLWVDEAHTLHDALAPEGMSLLKFPLGYLMTKGLIGLSGGAIDEWTLRLGPALLGALGIPLTYWAFRPCVGRRRAAVAALIVGVSSWHLYWSQSARAYTLAQDLALIGGGFVARGVLSGRRRPRLRGLVFAALAAFAHPSAALLLPVWVFGPALLQRAGVRLPRKYAGRPLLILTLVGLVLLGPWFTGVLIDYWNAKQGGSIKHFVLSTGFYLTPLLALGVLLGGLVAWKRREAFDSLALLACLTVLGGAVAASLFVVVTAQYVFVALPWMAVLATAPMETGLLRDRRLARWAFLALLLIPSAVDSTIYFGPRHGNRPRWGEAYAHVWAERGPEDLVVGMAAPVGEYYLRPGEEHLRSHRALVRLNPYFRFIPAHWARQGRRIWYVVRREDLATWEADDRAAFKEMLDTQCRMEATFEVGFTPRSLDVVVYVREANGRPE